MTGLFVFILWAKPHSNAVAEGLPDTEGLVRSTGATAEPAGAGTKAA